MRSLVRLALLVFAVPLLFSCGNGTGLFDTLSVATAVTPGNVSLGDTVLIHVTVTSLSAVHITPTCLAFFRVESSDGTVVGGDRHWGCVFDRGVMLRPAGQFDSFGFEFKWAANVGEGTYRVIGEAQGPRGYSESKPAAVKVTCPVCVGPAQ
jgi:hypothetical protein